MKNICACGCGLSPKYAGSRFVQGHHLKLTRKPAITNTCQQCGKEFVATDHRRRAKFCSRKCVGASTKTGEVRCCAECGASFYIQGALTRVPTRGKFCSNDCRITAWNRASLAAERPGSYQQNGWKVYQRKCADCGYDEHPEIVLLHHIDGNRKNGAISNLVPLCQNCHCLRHLAMTGSAQVSSARKHGKNYPGISPRLTRPASGLPSP